MPETRQSSRINYSGTVSIAPAVKKDVLELASLEAARMIEMYPPEERERRGFIVTAIGPSRFAELIEDRSCSVLIARVTELDGPWTAIGFAAVYGSARASRTFPYLDLFCGESENWAYLKSIAVDPRCEGRGVSWKLFRALVNEARVRGATAIYTEVSHSPPNLPSLALVRAGGLELVAEIPDPVKGFVWGLYRYEINGEPK